VHCINFLFLLLLLYLLLLLQLLLLLSLLWLHNSDLKATSSQRLLLGICFAASCAALTDATLLLL
jgi:hypothetical protein